MRYITETPMKPICWPAKVEPPGDTMVAVVKATVDLVPDGVATLAGEQLDIEAAEVLYEDKLGNSCFYPGDILPFKPRADLLLVGSCYPPSGKATRSSASFHMGSWKKELTVFGDRFWVPGEEEEAPVMTRPKEFSRMPLRYELAFGGEDSQENPHGRGMASELTPEGKSYWPLPNIEDPKHLILSADEHPAPAGFGPLDQMAPRRWKRRGTHDEKWMRRRRPYPPTDIDWTSNNAAPRNQLVDGYLSGEESIRLVNMDPEVPDYSTTLPGLRPRWFLYLVRPKKRYLFEVPLVLDTLWVNADERQAVLVWRGKTPVPKDRDEGEDLSVFFHESPGDTPRTVDDVKKMIAPPKTAEAPPAGAAAAMPDPPKIPEATQTEIAGLLDQARQTLKDGGVPADVLAKLDGVQDPDQFETILMDWTKAHFNYSGE